MKQPIIPVSEVVRRAAAAGAVITRAGVYKALKHKGLTEADLFGIKAVKVDKKLRAFLKRAKVRNGVKK